MKPEFANIFTITTTGQENDFVLSFFYEWQETEDGVKVDQKKEKVASVVMSASDVSQLSSVLGQILSKQEDGDANE